MPRRSQSTTDTDYEPSQGDGEGDTSSSQRRHSTVTLKPEELDGASARLVRYLLTLQGRSRLIRIDEIKKHALAPDHSKAVKQILHRAGHHLSSVFGLRLTELKKKGEFVLTNELTVAAPLDADAADAGGECHVVLLDSEEQRRGLIMAVLAAVYMNDGLMPEATMWSFLQQLSLSRDSHHPCFGDVKKFITQELVRSRFLKISAGPALNDRPTQDFSWGDHATAVISPSDVLQFVCQVWGENVEPSMWSSQYQRATCPLTNTPI